MRIIAIAGALAVATAAAAEVPYKAYGVRSPDGVTLAVQEWGNPSGPEILFIHGLLGSHLTWTHQVRSDLAKEFRLITFDLRGHGSSDKPLVPEAYRENKRWADDLDAIIKQTGLRHPVLVGWSYAGRVINDYLTHYGDAALAGIDYVDATTTAKPGVFGDAVKLLPLVASDDLATGIDGRGSSSSPVTRSSPRRTRWRPRWRPA